MSGIVNSTGAVSGVVGTTVGTPTAAGLVHLATLTAASYGSLAFEGYFSSNYTHYSFYFSVKGATNNTDTGVRMRQSNADVTSGSYYGNGWGGYQTGGTTSETTFGGWGENHARISSQDNTNNILYQTTGIFILANPLSTVSYKTWSGHSIGYNSGSPPSAIRNWGFAGQFRSTAVLSGISFRYDGGNIDGTVSMYGHAK